MRNFIMNRIWLVTALVVMLSACQVFAGGGRGGGYSYHGGGGHEHGSWLGFGIVAAALTLGAVAVATSPYYRYNDVYYSSCPPPNVYYQSYPPGYVVVQQPVVQPVVVMAPAAPQPVVVVQQPVAPTVTVSAPVVVQPPVVQPAVAPSTTATTASPDTGDYPINILNSDGTSYTSIMIHKKGNGYVGPQGEFYSDFPKVAQLKAMYGR